jgi:hypothetical protein
MCLTWQPLSGKCLALQRRGGWDLECRLIARPFPQPLEGQSPNREQWAALRAEMARVSGAVVFIGGAPIDNGKVVDADGVRAEFEAARRTGAFLISAGSTGGTAHEFANEMLLMPGDQLSKQLASVLAGSCGNLRHSIASYGTTAWCPKHFRARTSEQ